MTTLVRPDTATVRKEASWPVWTMVLLVFAGDFELRRRASTDAISGSVDLAILGELLVYLAIGGWLFLTVARPPRWRPFPSPLTAMWALVLVLATSALWAPSPTLGLARGSQLIVTAGLVTAIARRAGPQTWHRVAHGFVLLITLGVALGLVYRRPPEQQLTGRFMWLYGHPVVSGSLLVLSALFLLAWILDRNLPRFLPTPAYPVLFVVHFVALLATETRGSVLAFVVGAAVLVWLWASRSRRADLLLLTLVGLPAVIAVGWPALKAFALRGETASQLRGLNSRADLWSEAARVVAERPIQGQGYFASRQIFLESIGLGGAHNAFIEIAVSAGLVGLVCFAAMTLGTVRQLSAAGRHPDRPLIGGAFAALLVNGFTAQYFAQAGTGANVVFLMLVAWAASLNWHTRRS